MTHPHNRRDRHTPTIRLWTVRTVNTGSSGFDVVPFRYKRDAYRFVIDWFLSDLSLRSVTIEDEFGYADPLTLAR